MPDLTRNIDAIISAGIPLHALFSPEHGLWGSVQAGQSEPSAADERSALQVYDTYHREGEALDALVRASGVSEILVDIQDSGVRFYTYLWSLFDVMASAARLGISVVVLDRPNPLGSIAANGPGLLPEYASFVGRASIPLIHSLTLGELARQLNIIGIPEAAGRPVELSVIAMEGWQRSTPIDDSVFPWVPPSPNLPTPTSVHAYPGVCLFEGTNVSEGRGTTRPFEMVGAEWIDSRLVDALRERELPGVLFREHHFVPTFSKWAGERARGVQVHLVDPVAFEPIRTGVTMMQVIAELYPNEFRFLPPTRENGPHFLDLLWGSDVLRTQLGCEFAAILNASPEPAEYNADIRIYR